MHTVKEDAILAAAASTPVRVCSAGASGVSVLVAAIGWPVFGQPSVTAVGLVAFGAGVAAASAARQARRRPLEVRAVYRGALVCLFSTTDRRTLGQGHLGPAPGHRTHRGHALAAT